MNVQPRCYSRLFFGSLVMRVYLTLTDKESESSLTAIFNVETSKDMYVEVVYRKNFPSVAIIDPIGMPYIVQEAEYKNGAVTYIIREAAVGQWYIHTLAEDQKRLNITYGELAELSDSGFGVEFYVMIGITGGIVVFFIYYCVVRMIRNNHAAAYYRTNADSVTSTNVTEHEKDANEQRKENSS